MAGRGARTAEYIEVMRHLWADGVAEFSGEFYTRAGRPDGAGAGAAARPPILLGGTAPGRWNGRGGSPTAG